MRKVYCDKCRVELKSKYVQLHEINMRGEKTDYDSCPHYELCTNCFQLVRNFMMEDPNADSEKA